MPQIFNNKKLRITVILATLIIAVFVFFKFPINLGLDLKGGTRVILEAKDTPKIQVNDDTMAGLEEVIRNRIDALGISEPIIQRKGRNQLIVELAGIKDSKRAMKVIGDTAQLEFVTADWAPANIETLSPEKLAVLAGKDAKIGKLYQYDEKGNITNQVPLILKKTVCTGADLKGTFPGTDQYGKPAVNIEFTNEGAKKFASATESSIGRPLAILLDGKIISAPKVNSAIYDGRAQITGGFTINEMRDLVVKLKAGALPAPVEIVYLKEVGPMLGKDSIEASKKAGIIGIILVIIFMILVYRMAGVVASISLLLYILLLFAALQLIHATLTLPGIAGFILSIGMAVDANVLIFERIKEERRNGQPLLTAIDLGFNRAFRTILDTNVTTLISALFLFWLGSGSIKGFAVTLSLGIIISMFTAIFVSKLLLEGVSGLSLKSKFLGGSTEKKTEEKVEK